MSATLTWFNSGLGTKTGTAIGNFYDDLRALIDATDAGADFSWVLASSSVSSTPYYVVLKPKAGGAGRIMIISWSSAPAGNNSAILDGAPTTNQVYATYFPAGNVDTPSNLTASSGTIMGDDTGAVKCSPANTIGGLYGASYQPFYFDSLEGIAFGWTNPASPTTYFLAAGNLIVDAADNAYACVLGPGVTSISQFGGSSSACFPWIPSTLAAGTANPAIRTNYGSSNRCYFHAYVPSGNWATVAVSSTDILSNVAANKRYFAPVHLLGQTKGEGPVLKLRQIAFGSGTTSAFEALSTTGPVVKARQFCGTTTGGTGFPWFTNFKL